MKKMKTTTHVLTCCSLLIAGAMICGCASDHQAKPKPAKAARAERPYASNPSKIKFGEFKLVEIKATELNPRENGEGNRRSAAVIDQMLQAGLAGIWPALKVIPPGGDFSKSGDRVLQISPVIDHIRIVGVGGRVWLGVMAGGSDLVMHVDYRDSASGELIANPDFWQGNNAWAGAWSYGATDNQIRDAVVAQIVGYSRGNQ
jgi:hypothetical protein